MYRVLLYSDGFNKYKEKQGSARGVYMLPPNLLPEYRRSRRSFRLLGFTPPGVNTSDVLHLIADHISVQQRMEYIQPTQREILWWYTFMNVYHHRISQKVPDIPNSLQVIGYIGDFLEIAQVSDL